MTASTGQRRQRGAGSVHHRERDGYWCGQFTVYADGRRKRHTVYGKTREAAESALAAGLRSHGIEPLTSEPTTRRPTTLELARAKATHTDEDWQFKLAAVGCCVYCGTTDQLEKDHATPVSRGGDDGLGNVVPACRPCNMSKGTATAAEFLVDRILSARQQ